MINLNNIYSVVKSVKSKTSLDLICADRDSRLAGNDMLSQVKAVEEMLTLESSEQIIETLTKDQLKTAGDMFIYLNTCPKHDMEWFESWRSFYKTLFLTKPADQIILKLNRMTKTEEPQNMDAKIRAEKLLKRASSLMSLKFEQIQRMLPEKGSRNEFVLMDSMIQNGRQKYRNVNFFIVYYFQI